LRVAAGSPDCRRVTPSVPCHAWHAATPQTSGARSSAPSPAAARSPAPLAAPSPPDRSCRRRRTSRTSGAACASSVPRASGAPPWTSGRTGDHDPVLTLDAPDPLGQWKLADLHRLPHQRRVQEVEPPIEPQREPRVGDVEPRQAARRRNDVPVADPPSRALDGTLGDVVAGTPIEFRFDGADRFQVGRVGELPVRLGMRGHEVDPPGVGDSAELPGHIAHDPLRLAVGDPIAEIVEPARVAVDDAAAVADAGEFACEAIVIVEAALADEASHGQGAFDEGDAVELAEVDDEALGAFDLEGPGRVGGPDEGEGDAGD